jgi:hypothetical protein
MRLVLRHISKSIVSMKPSGTRTGLSLRGRAEKYLHTGSVALEESSIRQTQ